MPVTKIIVLGLILAYSCMSAKSQATGFDPLDTYSVAKVNKPPAANCNIPEGDEEVALAELVNIALCNNPTTGDKWHAYLASQARLGSARSAYLPQVNATESLSHADSSISGSSSTSLTSRLALSYLLFDFGGREALNESAKQTLISSRYNYDDTLQNVIFSTVKAYYDYMSSLAVVETAKDSVAATKSAFDAASLRYKVGAVPLVDKLQTRTAFSQATLEKAQSENSAEKARGLLLQTIGLQPDKPLKFTTADKDIEKGKEFNQSVSDAIELAKKSRPDIAAMIADVENSKAITRSKKAKRFPSIALAASAERDNYSANSSQDKSAGTIGIAVTIPLFSGFQTTYDIRAAKEDVKSRKAQLETLKQQASLDVWNKYNDFKTATDTLELTNDVLESAIEAFDSTLGRYKAGVGSIVDLLKSEADLSVARKQRVQAVYGWHTARAALFRAIGTINEEVANEKK